MSYRGTDYMIYVNKVDALLLWIFALCIGPTPRSLDNLTLLATSHHTHIEVSHAHHTRNDDHI